MRLVTHYDVDREGCEMALAALAAICRAIPASETGPIRPVAGKEMDAILTRDHLTA
jgi:hypothetical protein